MNEAYDVGVFPRDDFFDIELSDEEVCDYLNWLETECKEEEEEEKSR